ncbi:MAG: imidazole glycerol phosphate synthase subunit HisF [Candidatus Peribacteraceae bacterium]|jgi:cyclase
MQVIPAIDVLDGRIVRLRQGDFARVSRFDADPAALVRTFASAGAARLHLVNLSGARDGSQQASFLSLVRQIARTANVDLQVGGGIRTLRDMSALFEAGANRMVLGTTLFTNPDLVRQAISLFGIDGVVAALDVRDGTVRIEGWREGTGMTLNEALQRVEELGISDVLITDIARDGMGEGPNTDLYRRLCRTFPTLRITASGGIRGPADIRALRDAGCTAAVVGKALIGGEVTLQTLLRAEASDLAIRVIPCLDVADGRTVKGTKFENLRDAGDPADLAERYCAEGADELVFLDITATREERQTTTALVARVAERVNIPFTVGGGIRTIEDARMLLCAGADKVAVNSAAIRRPELLSDMAAQLGSANTVCAIDARKSDGNWTVLIDGGTKDTGRDAVAWAEEAVKRGAGELLVTSFDRDGTGTGFDTTLIARMKARVSVPVIASGGGGTLSSFVEAARAGADALLAASVFHFETFRIRDVKQALATNSFPVRL